MTWSCWVQPTATAFSRKQMVSWVRGLRRRATMQTAIDVEPGGRRRLSSPALPGLHSYARCTQPGRVEMQAQWEAPRCHRYGSPEPGDLCLHFQGIRKTHREMPIRTSKNQPKIFAMENSGKKMFPVFALGFIWIRMFSNMVIFGLLSKKNLQVWKAIKR